MTIITRSYAILYTYSGPTVNNTIKDEFPDMHIHPTNLVKCRVLVAVACFAKSGEGRDKEYCGIASTGSAFLGRIECTAIYLLPLYSGMPTRSHAGLLPNAKQL